MVGLGLTFLFIFASAFYFCAQHKVMEHRWLLKLAVIAIPFPWLACEMGWVVAEMGRQPWTIAGILPTNLSSSSLSTGSLHFSLAGFIGFYTLLLITELYLMIKYRVWAPPACIPGNIISRN